MKAIVFAETGGPEVLTLAEAPKPSPRPGSVLIKNHAIGVNFADTRFRQGLYTVKPKLPDIPGMEVAGVVEAVGDGVTNVRPGMRVAAFTRAEEFHSVTNTRCPDALSHFASSPS